MSVITAIPRASVGLEEKQKDFIDDRSLPSEIRRRVLSYLSDETYIKHFDLRIDSEDASLITFGTGIFGLKLHPKAPERVYDKLGIEFRFVESAAHLTADLIARMAATLLSAFERQALAPETFWQINGYDLTNGLAVNHVFEIYLHGAEDWHPKNS